MHPFRRVSNPDHGLESTSIESRENSGIWQKLGGMFAASKSESRKAHSRGWSVSQELLIDRKFQAGAVAVIAATLVWIWRRQKIDGASKQTLSNKPTLILKVPDLEVHFYSTGASIRRIITADRDGRMEDITLGHPSHTDYTVDPPQAYFGCVVGRVANRIRKGRFSVGPDARAPVHSLETNDGAHALHGGSYHWGKQKWEHTVSTVNGCPSVRFTRTSPNKEAGYPGTVHAIVTYTLSRSGGKSSLSVRMEASTDASTPINMVQHTYWNLAGKSAILKGADVKDHTIRLFAKHMTPVSSDLIPTGAIVPVVDTVFDFLEGSNIGDKLNQLPSGLDHNWVTGTKASPAAAVKSLCSEPGGMHVSRHLVAEAHHALSGRRFQLESNAPGVQFYSGNFLGNTPGKDGAVYAKHTGFCLETQTFPNGVNQENFPSPVVCPGEVYCHDMKFTFSHD